MAPEQGEAVELVAIDEDNVGDVYDLKVTEAQSDYVASNPWSLAQALAEYDIAWPRAIVADGTVVGFVMLEIDPNESDGRPFWLWRLMVAADHQGKGYGRAGLRLALDEARRRGAQEIWTSWLEGEHSAGPFYLREGFVPNGEIKDDETVACLRLT